MNHDFDNEFETDDELKRGRSRRKDGRKYASSGLTGRTGSTGRGSRTARTAARSGKSRLRTIIIFIVAEIIALALIGAGWYGKRMMSLMQTDTEFNKSDMTNPYISVEKEQAMKGYWTVALFGVDSLAQFHIYTAQDINGICYCFPVKCSIIIDLQIQVSV